MNSTKGLFGMLPTILFFVTGLFWAGIVATGGSVLLSWAALTCFVSGGFLIVWASNWATRPLTIATALFGLSLTVYQIGASLTLGTGLGAVGVYSGALFAVFTVVYLYLLFAGIKSKA